MATGPEKSCIGKAMSGSRETETGEPVNQTPTNYELMTPTEQPFNSSEAPHELRPFEAILQ